LFSSFEHRFLRILSLLGWCKLIWEVGMSDLGNFAKLARSTAQLPVNVYFDERLLQQEIRQLFHHGPRYAGHALMVPNVGDYATLAWENEGRMLVRNAHGIELLSNVCRHRQAKMFEGR